MVVNTVWGGEKGNGERLVNGTMVELDRMKEFEHPMAFLAIKHSLP